MGNHIQDFIESGILEAYVTGSASEADEKEVLYMKSSHPQVKDALAELEADMEKIARGMAITPPPGIWNRIEAEFNDLTHIPHQAPLKIGRDDRQYQHGESAKKDSGYIEVESESAHMRVHKTWKWVFVAVFVLGKIFLATAIYFYLENRQAQQNIQELKQEIRALKSSSK